VIYYLVHGRFLILRTAGAAVLGFLIVLLLGPKVIRFLVRKKIGDRPEFDRADLNELTRHKSMTPTMGGVLVVLAVFVGVLLFANLGNMYIRMSLLALVWLGGVGAADDWLKLRHAAGQGAREGLFVWEKILYQIGLAVLLSIYMYRYGGHVGDTGVVNTAHEFYFPFRAGSVHLPLAAYVVITLLTMVGSSNAVNLADGMDGLAGGCVSIVSFVLLLLAWIVGVEEWSMFFRLPLVHGSAEMTVICAAIIGSCIGFLWYNAYPAQVFMGDTGSLPLGGLMGYVAVVTRQELVLVIAGGVFVMEAGSVILQVGYYKMTKPPGGMAGRRIFRCAPLHHHFHLGGWPESKVVTRFWVLGMIFAAMALATLKLR
jgi:phospho-N-acetylmuramoyl-pentapeptide-transferase